MFIVCRGKLRRCSKLYCRSSLPHTDDQNPNYHDYFTWRRKYEKCIIKNEMLWLIKEAEHNFMFLCFCFEALFQNINLFASVSTLITLSCIEFSTSYDFEVPAKIEEIFLMCSSLVPSKLISVWTLEIYSYPCAEQKISGAKKAHWVPGMTNYGATRSVET